MHHGISVSERQLKRILNERLRLFQRKHYSEVGDVRRFIQQELQRSGRLNGYRMMHRKCLNAGHTVRRETVRQLLSEMDPEGVTQHKRHRLTRRRYNGRGPNFLWHIDSYDKLRPYGIGINGCIDGFLRKLIWLEANNTTNDPRVIGRFFLKAVDRYDGCPRVVRTDCGSENSHVANFRRFLRENDEDAFAGDKSFLYGRSTANQRIECWWSMLRKMSTEYWITLFRLLLEEGYFSDSILDREDCVGFGLSMHTFKA